MILLFRAHDIVKHGLLRYAGLAVDAAPRRLAHYLILIANGRQRLRALAAADRYIAMRHAGRREGGLIIILGKNAGRHFRSAIDASSRHASWAEIFRWPARCRSFA